MTKLLVIADDLTGAMDTGVQFKARDTIVQVYNHGSFDLLGAASQGRQVLIVDAETRHMRPEDAGHTVSQIVAWAVKAGIPCIYKKTDSGLRGNIGSELSSMLLASKAKHVHFIPAFPQMGRTTVNGLHYINSIPVADSVFGRDPFEPVLHSAVADIIAEQSCVTTHLMGAKVPEHLPKGILIYDSASEDELHTIANGLRASRELHLLAGCAGFAAVLPRLLDLDLRDETLPDFQPGLLTICGSINPITMKQLNAAEAQSAFREHLTPEQKLIPGWLDSPEGQRCTARWMSQIQQYHSAILECNGVNDTGATQACAQRLGIDLEEMRRRISDTMGGLLKRLLDLGLERTLMVTGGDTLLAFLRHIHEEQLVPIQELMPGVVLSQVQYRGKTFNLISKSGGFGSETLLVDLEDLISDYTRRKLNADEIQP